MLCTVYESFKDYVTVETMDGVNKYDAGDHGLQVGVVSCNRAHVHCLVVSQRCYNTAS